MATMTIPATWTRYKALGDEVMYTRPSNALGRVDVVSFKRVPPTAFAGTGIHTSKYQVKFSLGLDVDPAGEYASVSLPNSIVTLDIRNVEGQSALSSVADGDVHQILQELGTLCTSPAFRADVTQTLSLPGV